MSTSRKTIENTGKKGVDLQFTEFYGGEKKGAMLQISQGFGGTIALAPAKEDEPGFIQLTGLDAYKLVQEVTSWLQDVAKDKADDLKKEIEANKCLEKTIFADAVDCGHYISDLKMLEIPLRLLSVVKGK